MSYAVVVGVAGLPVAAPSFGEETIMQYAPARRGASAASLSKSRTGASVQRLLIRGRTLGVGLLRCEGVAAPDGAPVYGLGGVAMGRRFDEKEIPRRLVFRQAECEHRIFHLLQEGCARGRACPISCRNRYSGARGPVPATSRPFRAFVEATGYVTFAEVPSDPRDYPGALRICCARVHVEKIGQLTQPVGCRAQGDRLFFGGRAGPNPLKLNKRLVLSRAASSRRTTCWSHST
jgi:hypothetical protein